MLRRVTRALSSNVRRPLFFRTRTTAPPITAARIGPVILINRESNRLTLFRSDSKVWRVFPVATGQAIYPTPTGRFHIVVKWVNPWWYPPTQDAWAQGLSPVPPGPDNPLGTRWMGLSVPGVGIHGTDEPSSIGWNASHGCIRMQVVDSEWLFTHVRIGTTVYIV
jgi:lipoprotein-anchoring transpeptidase ErfK/SrfK